MDCTDIVLTVYFDGLCKVCSKEINHYKKQIGAEKINFIDICSDQFDPIKEKLDPYEIHKIMHVRKSDGSLAVRVDAFIEIWRHIPRYQKNNQCADSPYCEIKKN